jgi:uncharacterized membrane protein SpoIIM required for sporulation
VDHSQEDQKKLQELRTLLTRSRGRKLRNLNESELRALPRLYRFVSSLLSRLQTQGNAPGTLNQAEELLRRSHAVLYQGTGQENKPWYRKLYELFTVHSPRALRAEWRLFGFTLIVFYSISIGSYVAVSQQLELAFSLFDPGSVATEISQLEATEPGEPFRGNFVFGEEDSARIAGWIMAHNMGVCLLFFASGLLAPFFVYLLTTNAIMLGVYTAVAAHWGQAGAISSILWCHGVLEIQAIVIAGMAGLILLRAWIAPGAWSRTYAMQLELPRALHVLAPAFPMLFVAGLIEGFISPHAPTNLRMLVAVITGIAFLSWLFLAGRRDQENDTRPTSRTPLASRSRS